MLLKSWAMPPARVPMASIFCDCSSWRSRLTFWVTSSAVDSTPHHRAPVVVQGHLFDFEQHVRAPDVAGGQFTGERPVAAHDVDVRGPHRVHVLPAKRQGVVVVVAQVVEFAKPKKSRKARLAPR